MRNFWLALTLVVQIVVGLPAAAGSVSFVDSAGRTVQLPEQIDRVLAAGPPASVLLYALAPDKMVGWVREPSDEEQQYLASPQNKLPAYGRLTGKGNTANIEVVLSLKPDLIIDVGSIDPTYISLADRVQEQTGIPYVLIDGSFAGTPDTIRRAGELLGVTAKSEELAAYAQRSLSHLQDVLAQVPEAERPSVYYGRGPDGLETGLAGSINTEVLAAVGARNVANAAGKGGLASVSLEQVLAWNPDVILTLDERFDSAVRSDPAWSNLPAVKRSKIFRAPAAPFGWFDSPPGINRLIGVPWLLSILYPKIDHGNLRDTARDFYRLFYHVDLTELQLDFLLPSVGATSDDR